MVGDLVGLLGNQTEEGRIQQRERIQNRRWELPEPKFEKLKKKEEDKSSGPIFDAKS